MTPIQYLLDILVELGISIHIAEDELVLKGKTQRLSSKQITQTRNHKSELLGHLRRLQIATCEQATERDGIANVAPTPYGRLPFVDERGDLHISLDTPPRHRWWQGGQSIAETLAELNVSPDVWRRYVPEAFRERNLSVEKATNPASEENTERATKNELHNHNNERDQA